MNANKLTKQEKDALNQYIKHFSRKAVQIIVQSRLGEKKPTKSRIHGCNTDWFYLSVKDLLQITAITKSSLVTDSIFNLGTPFCVEISLKTPENQSMILETWCISYNEQLCDCSQKICYNVYKKMSMVLRSLLCISRSLPTYQLSRRQSAETYILLYRMYCGEPIVHQLGDKYATAKVGTIATPIGSIMLNVAFRTRLTMTPQNLSFDTIIIKDDHFREENLSKDIYVQNQDQGRSNSKVQPETKNIDIKSSRNVYETNEYEEKSHMKCRSMPIAMKNQASFSRHKTTQGGESSDECSHNSSVGSTPSDTMYYFKLKSAAFTPSSVLKDLSLTGEATEIPPFMSLLTNELPHNSEQSSSGLLPNQSPVNEIQKPTHDLEDTNHINSKIKTLQTDDFVLIEPEKIAFGFSDAANDLSTFFKSCDNPPIIESFNIEPNLTETLQDLDQQLLTYESKVAEFDDLVKTFEN